MGFFDSDSTTENTERTDARQNQAGGNVQQSTQAIDVKADDHVSVSTTQTDHGAIQAALGLAGDVLTASSEEAALLIDKISDSERRSMDAIERMQAKGAEQFGALLDSQDTASRRNTDLTRDVLNNVSSALDTGHRRNADLTRDIMSEGRDALAMASANLDAGHRRNADLTERLADKNLKAVALVGDVFEGFTTGLDTANRRSHDMQLAVHKGQIQVIDSALEFTDAQNRRNHDLQRELANAQSDTIAGAFSFGDDQSRRASDLAGKSIDAVTGITQQLVEQTDNQSRRDHDFLLSVTSNNRQQAESAFETIEGISEDAFNTMTSALEEVRKNGADSLTGVADLNKSLASQYQNALQAQNDTATSLAKSVSVGNEEGTNRIVMMLIVAVSLSVVAMFIYLSVK